MLHNRKLYSDDEVEGPKAQRRGQGRNWLWRFQWSVWHMILPAVSSSNTVSTLRGKDVKREKRHKNHATSTMNIAPLLA